jgi:RNA polymerase sigma-70 factor (TIGR02943 family)
MRQAENMESTRNLNSTDPTTWVDHYADYLFSYTMSRIGDEDLARDLVQETFLAALERRDQFEGRSSEKTWLTSILKNKIVDVYRRRASGLSKNNDVAASELAQANYFEPETGHWNPKYQPMEFGIEANDVIIGKELTLVLQKCMKKLPELWLAVFTMKHVDEEPAAVICSDLRLTPANFWVIIHRAKLNLRACLQKSWL